MRVSWLILPLVLAACAPQTVKPLRQYEIATDAYRGEATKQIVGSLQYEYGCLTFQGEDPAVRFMPVWPDGSMLEEALLIFHRPGKHEQRVAIGEEIRLDGVPAKWVDLHADRYARFQRQCVSDPIFVSAITPAN